MLKLLIPLLQKLAEIALPFIRKKVVEVVANPEPLLEKALNLAKSEESEKKQEVKEEVKAEILDWNNPKSKINKRFSVKEATFLPSWGISHIPNDEEKAQIIDIATRIDHLFDELESQLNKKLIIDCHVFIRPGTANAPGSKWDKMDYNRFLYETQVWKDLTAEEKSKKKVPNSPHKRGNAVDFHVLGFEKGEGCDQMREIVLPHLEKYGLRMEDLPKSGWVHLDSNPVINKRFFKP